MKIAIVYDSGYGHTAKLAHYIGQGVEKVEDAKINIISLSENPEPWDLLEDADAIIFGSPTYNASVSARFKKFMEDSTKPVFSSQKWTNKIAAGFTNSGAMHGDKLNSLMTMALFAAQHGMIWVGLNLPGGTSNESLNRIGGWLGAMAQSDNASADITPIESDLQTASFLGERVATITRQFKK